MENEYNIEDLCETIADRKEHLRSYVEMTEGHWQAMMRRLADFKIAAAKTKGVGCHDEEIWTYLTSLAYAEEGFSGNNELFQKLTDSTGKAPFETKQWLEPLPLPPRKGEGNTNLDLAMGAIQKREKTSHGIEFDSTSHPILFCEMKWFSDLSYGVSGDPHRNQLIRVIENAITFQCSSNLPRECHVTLETPREFKRRKHGSRFYQYKFEEYSDPESGAEAIHSELESCRLEHYKNPGWTYPEENVVKGRVRNLKLHWVAFENLIEEAPRNEIADLVRQFEKKYNHTSAGRK